MTIKHVLSPFFSMCSSTAVSYCKGASIKRLLLSSILGVFTLQGMQMQAFPVKATLAVSGMIGTGAAAHFAVRKHAHNQSKRAQWIHNFVIVPLMQPHSFFSSQIAIEETKHILTLYERLQVIAWFVEHAHAVRNSSQESDEGLRALSRAKDMACCVLTQEDSDLVGWIAAIKISLPCLLELYCGHDEAEYQACLTQVRNALTEAQKQSSSISYYIAAKSREVYRAIKSTVHRVHHFMQRKPARGTSLFA